MKIIPKVKFELIEFEGMYRLINSFLRAENSYDWSEVVLGEYPDLKKLRKGIQDKEKLGEVTREYFEKKYEEIKDELKEDVERFQESWNLVNDSVMKVLSKVIEIDWSKNFERIIARVSMNPICPRFIEYKIFDVFHKIKNESMRELATHEISHFIYFEKWKKVFPETPKEEFDEPYLVWHLSEMVAPIILGDERITKIIPKTDEGYDEHQAIMIGEKNIIECLQEIYDSRKDFEDFLRKSWKFVQEHEEKIK